MLGIVNRSHHAIDAAAAWRQIATRDASANGQFVYAVRTTGIYCRPSCPSHVDPQAQSSLGMTPAQYRARGAQQNIRYATAPCALGHILVAATERGICSVALGDGPAQLAAQLQQEFPQAAITQDAVRLAPALLQVLSHLSQHPRSIELPLDIRATAFQQCVWQALRQIPRGQTVSYAQLAASLGQPKAARAVARACAQNPIALLTPCHRVVGSDGRLSGYRWGVQRKRTLLYLEANE